MSQSRGIDTFNNQEDYVDPFPVFDVPNCKCGVEAKVMVAWTEKNPGRRFFRCANWKSRQCTFFSWYDEEYAPHIKHMLTTMRREKEALLREEEKLKGELFYQKYLNNRSTVLDSIAMETEIEQLTGNTARMIELEKENKELKYEKGLFKKSLIAVVVLCLCIVLAMTI
ncbi:uncharacterized protein LOC126673032 [Mercurialis annua]|uniref:uncharacterized protein LOC126673032 n=1 Tax=Mercurialis annua TaxID=3986 RepID=UPI002160711F|nr:uncharacterized protein LOC126673032 [Mercurialis annua]